MQRSTNNSSNPIPTESNKSQIEDTQSNKKKEQILQKYKSGKLGGSEISDNRSEEIGITKDEFKRVYNESKDKFNKAKRGISKKERKVDKRQTEINRREREIAEAERRINKAVRKHDEKVKGKETDDIKIVKSKKKDVRISIQKPTESDSRVVIERYADYRPSDQQKYFPTPNGVDINGERNGLGVVIPFFNEPSHELQQTLHSLQNAWIYNKKINKKWKDEKMHLLIIQDGWHKADHSMKEYIKRLFPKKISGKDWWDYYPEFKDYEKERDGSITFVLRIKDYSPVIINPQSAFEGKREFMSITLIIKIDNRRKHNSHEWFMHKNGFGQAIHAKYLFMTDAFTLFNDTCLFHLIKQMDNDNNLSAVTGRQRVMTREQQGTYESMFSFAHVLRNIQMFDFELSNSVYNGAFSLGGFLPVIPGPCGMYRAKHLLQDAVRDWYFGVVNSDPNNTGSVLGNLKIAEDRVLSSAAVLKTDKETSMAFNPLAIFYFEAETDLRNFMFQRRRWINGSVAGYIYLLFMGFSHFKDWNASFIRKFYIWFLLFSQFIIYCMVGVSPGILLRALYYGIDYMLGIGGIEPAWELIVVAVVLWIIYGLHIFIHHKYRFNYGIIYFLVFLSLCISVTSIGSVIHYIFFYNGGDVIQNIIDRGYPMYVGLFAVFMPFILSFMLAGRAHSTLYMIKSFLHYILLIPLVVAWFGSYAYSRTWDMSWGNRPTGKLDVSKDQRKNMVRKFKEDSVKLVILSAFLNIGIFFVPLEGQLYLMSTFFTIASVQMIFSLIFMCAKISYKCYFCRKNKDIDSMTTKKEKELEYIKTVMLEKVVVDGIPIMMNGHPITHD